MQERLWIVESLANRLRIIAPNENGANALLVAPELPESFSRPFGIVQSPQGPMLVAEYSLNHRIVSVDSNGNMEVFCDRKEKNLENCFARWRLPSAPDRNTGFWVVESHTHRAQKFDWAGQHIGQIGNCGIADGSLLVPWHAVQFTDGTVAINQHLFIKCIKLISPEGKELDCLFTDYLPAGMLVDGDRLLVADWSGGSIRLYERTG